MKHLTFVTRFGAVVALFATLVLSGCATPTTMALKTDDGADLQSGKPIYLMSATLKNKFKVSHQPKLAVVNVERAVVNGSQDRLNFRADEKGRSLSEDPAVGNSYKIRLQLEPGEYVLRGLTSQSTGFLIMGSFFTPIHEDLAVGEPGVYYLGHIDATVRERQGEEFKAGSTVPLLDQSVVGASGGTFDVTISDQWDKDRQAFLTDFPALKNVEVKKAILPEFNRERAQKWWEDN